MYFQIASVQAAHVTTYKHTTIHDTQMKFSKPLIRLIHSQWQTLLHFNSMMVMRNETYLHVALLPLEGHNVLLGLSLGVLSVVAHKDVIEDSSRLNLQTHTQAEQTSKTRGEKSRKIMNNHPIGMQCQI